MLTESCYYDVEEEIYPIVTCDTASISFSDDVLPIIQDNCYTCHNQAANFGNVTLEGYDNLRIHVDNGNLLGTITWSPGFSPMPQTGAKLLDCEVAKIDKWIKIGAPNN